MELPDILKPDASRDAIELLKEDHREVETLFKEFEHTDDKREKVALASVICHALAVHAEIEEQLFYPESRLALDGRDDVVDEAVVEHATLKTLMEKLKGMSADDELFTAYVTVLKEYVQHHVKEEENEYFPCVRATDLDLQGLAKRMQHMKSTLLERQPPRVTADVVDFAPRTPGPVALHRPTDRTRSQHQ